MKLPRTVVVLGLVSFFTDLSSEMIYPLLPLFLAGALGATPVALGLIEGIAESVAALLKLVSGYLADRTGKRKPWVLGGYGVAGLARPLIGLAGSWPVVLMLRFTDRVGKGLRSSPRDALISDVIQPEIRGRAYGFHRSMDHAGAVLGPLVAAGLIFWFGFAYDMVFLAAGIPSIIVILLIVFLIKEKPANAKPAAVPDLLGQWRRMSGTFKRFLLVLGLFVLGNASDLFLLYALSEQGGLAPWGVALLWAAHNLIKIPASQIAGAWSDKGGRRAPIALGWLVHALVYLAFALITDPTIMIVIFLFYGISDGLAEPAGKALIADLAPEGGRGTAFGYFHMINGLAALPASLAFGWVWVAYSPAAAFVMGSALAFAALAGLMAIKAVQA